MLGHPIQTIWLTALLVICSWHGWSLAAEAPSAVDDSSIRNFVFRLQEGKLSNGTKVVRVKQGELVRLKWTSDRNDTIHLHGYDLELHLEPDTTTAMVFPAVATGRFPVSVHRFDHQLHQGGENSASSRSTHQVLLYLEVHPN